MDNLEGKKPNSKLSRTDVMAIMDAHDTGTSTARDLSFHYGVSVETIRRIWRGDTWTQTTHTRAQSTPESRKQDAAKLFAELQKASEASDKIPEAEWNEFEQKIAALGATPRYSQRALQTLGDGFGNKHKFMPATENRDIPPNPMDVEGENHE